MLVCNVSLRPPRSAIAATIAEAVVAADATATGNIVFATLVDDPASVGDIVDAYSGEIMLEAATTTETVEAGLIYVAGIAEEITATEAWDGVVPTVYSAAVAEALTAVATQDGALTSAAVRSAMVAGRVSVFVNATMSREANVGGTMVNL